MSFANSNEEGSVVETTDSEESYLTCGICNECLEPYHQSMSSDLCNHIFHAICIHVWLSQNTNCPICDRRISLTSNLPSKIIFTTALMISYDMTVERVSFTYAFISLMLRRFNTKQKWKNARDIIIMASENFEHGSIHLPFLDLSSMRSAEKEKQKWRVLFFELTGESPSSSSRIQNARRLLIDSLAFMLDE